MDNVINFKSPREDFENLKYYEPVSPFNGCIIVPTGHMHDSGYQCMKFVLTKGNEIVGCVGGTSDVIHLNGIGGYGKIGEGFLDAVKIGTTKAIDWSIDCLENGLLRIFCSYNLMIDDIICSDFSLYVNFKRGQK